VTPSAKNPSLDEVLDAFAVESVPNQETLDHYLLSYPDFAGELIDLFRELQRDIVLNEATENDARIDLAWQRHVEAGPFATDPFAALSLSQIRDLASKLDVPRQVVTAVRDRKLEVSSIPKRFLARLAAELNSSVDLLLGFLSVPGAVASARSYKADNKPSNDHSVTFERVLIDAGVPEDKRARLLEEAE
jgi:hypothetical protein